MDDTKTDLELELRARLKGEVRFDSTSRLLYATDASIYQIIPVGVVIPRHAGDVVETVKLAAKHGVPVLPRGSGTSLAGQTVGAAVVLDFTKYMNEVLELNVEERWVRVQPGVILDELNAWLKPHGMKFAPDVATSNRASIGGMMGNNSCGAHSLLYGKTVDHVLEQRVVLSDGTESHFRELSEEEWEQHAAREGLEGQVYREITRICRGNAVAVEEHFPKIMRRVGGYNLDEFVRRERRNLALLAVGSEGTLCTVTEAKLRLVPTPRFTALLVSQFDDLLASLAAVQAILPYGPAAVEVVDRIILDLTRDNRELAWARSFLSGNPEAILLTEFYSEEQSDVVARVERLKEALEAAGHGYAHVALPDAAGQKKVWEVRKAGLGLLMGMKGEAKPAGFIEDTAVAPEVLSEYIGEFRALLGEYGLDACYYAHASVGCLHVRPVLNLKEETDRQRMREISGRVAELVLKHGGAMSAEHGDGLARSEWQERMFGPEVYRAFREVKAAFDPQGIMNPGKIVDAPPMNANLRFAPGYRTLPVLTHFDFSMDGGFAGAVEMCSGVGACRKKTDGTMCPSYRATMEEAHSTRGRANMLRMVLSGQGSGFRVQSSGTGQGSGARGQGPEGDRAATGRDLFSRQVQPAGTEPRTPNPEPSTAPTHPHTHTGSPPTPNTQHPTPNLADPRLMEVLDLCLECKACKSECPSNVDMAKLKYEFLAHYHAEHGTPLRARLFGRLAAVSPLASAMAPLANRMMEWSWTRALLERFTGIDRRRPLPRFAWETFGHWFRKHRPDSRAGKRGEVLLLADTFTQFQEPEVGQAAVQVLEAFGYQVRVPKLRCCGRTMISKGMLAPARENAEYNVRLLEESTRDGLPLLGLEPSCVVTFRDEYRDWGLGSAAEAVSRNTWMVDQFLAERHGEETGLPFGETPREVRLHGHCHQKAILGTRRTLEALRMAPGYRVTEIPSGCCGMAGTFGYEQEHYDLSLKIGELSLFPHVRSAPEDALLVAPGTSCRHQIRDGTGREALHPMQALALALRS